MNKMIEALIFDMDGTLVDSERTHWQAWHDTLVAHGLQVPAYADFKVYVGVSDEQMADEFCESSGRTLDPLQLVTVKSENYLRLISEVRLLPGVRDTIDRYRNRYRLAVASSSPYDDLIAILEHHDLRQHFSYVIGGDMVDRKKPNPEIYLKVTGLLGAAPSACVAFEDSHSGVSAAKNAGLLAVAVPHAMSMDHDFSRADIILESLSEVDDELLHKLASLNNRSPGAPASADINRRDRAGTG